VLGGAGSGDANGGGVPYFLGDKDTWLFAAVAHNVNRSKSVAVNPRKAGFFLRDFQTTTSYRPIWGHLQVQRVGATSFVDVVVVAMLWLMRFQFFSKKPNKRCHRENLEFLAILLNISTLC